MSELKIVCIDMETYWCTKTGYTLSKMPSVLYVRDQRFKAHGASIKVNGGRTQWVTGAKLPYLFSKMDWSKVCMLGHNCVDGETEVLTPSGWVRFDEYEGQQVLQADPASGALSFVAPLASIRKPYLGPVYEWDTTYHKGLYTPDHRMFVRRVGGNRYLPARACAVADESQNNVYVWTSAELDGLVSLPEWEARLLEAVRADGHVSPDFDVRFQLPLRKARRLYAICDNLGITYSSRVDGGRVYVVNLHRHGTLQRIARMLGAGKAKAYGAWVLDLSLAAKQVILEEARYWDGCDQDRQCGSYALATAKADEAAWLQVLAHTSGHRIRWGEGDNAKGFNAGNLGATLHQGTVKRTHGSKLVEPPAVRDFDGTVYCLTVPTGAFMVRRRGVVWITGNCPFDAHILSYHYGVRPARYIDTLGMARAVLGGSVKSRSLDNVAAHFGLAGKLDGGKALYESNGVRDLDPGQEVRMAAYAVQDADATWEVFRRLAREFPRGEYEVLDWTIRMITEPRLLLDVGVLDAAHEAEKARKAKLLADLAIDQKVINSNKQFAELLQALGIDPPKKLSKTAKNADGTPKVTWAFAKSDMDFVDLKQHADETVAALVDLRLSTKSTIEETRAGMYAEIGRSSPQRNFPIVLLYSGAMQTHRLSGGDNQNSQNLGRKSPVKKGIVAPEGHTMINADLSQIELRVSLLLSGQTMTLGILAEGGCVYSDFATDLFGVTVTKDLASRDPAINEKRQVGKVSILQLGYQSGWRTFQRALWFQTGIKLPSNECERIVDMYRTKYSKIRSTWRDLQQSIAGLAAGGDWAYFSSMDRWPVKFEPYRIVGPSGLALKYPELHQRFSEIRGEKEFVYKNWASMHDGQGWVTLYGGKLKENLCQFMARETLTDQTKRLNRRGLFTSGQVHDALIFVVPDAEVDAAVKVIHEEMTRRLTWWPMLPLDVEIAVGKSYGTLEKVK